MGLPAESLDISSAEEAFAAGFRRCFATPNSLVRTSRSTPPTSLRKHAKMRRAHRRRSDRLEAARDETLVWSWWRERTWDRTLSEFLPAFAITLFDR